MTMKTFIVAIVLLFGALVTPTYSVTCPKASLEECLNGIPKSSCEDTRSWLRFHNSPLSSQNSCICSDQKKAMETICKDNCPPASCLACLEMGNKAVSDCRGYYYYVGDSAHAQNCDSLEKILLQHCSQMQICPACRSSYCQNGGVCNSSPSTSCSCTAGYTGIYCQTYQCDDEHKCQHGGTCTGKNTCTCPDDFSGPQCARLKLGTARNPAPNAKTILEAGDSKGSGLYWIKPPGENDAALTYCDMDYQGGGWMLASYGYVHAVTANSLNRNIPNMNNPMGYMWKPTSRSSTNGLVNLTHGAVMMARSATFMIMAAGNNPKTGGIGSYNYIYRVDIRQARPYNITFANHNRYHGAVGGNGIPKMHLTEFMVDGLKGDTGQYLRYALAESLGVTWGDSFPTGYGFYQHDLPYGSFSQGPFFPSLHSGDGHSSCNAAYSCRLFQPDVNSGSELYVHNGWYTATTNKQTGQTSIWFK